VFKLYYEPRLTMREALVRKLEGTLDQNLM
jgi:hypothetical protein